MFPPLAFGTQFSGSSAPNVIKSANRGSVFYVDSNAGGSSTGGRTPETAVTTIDAAINLCNTTGNVGDTIYVMPGHAETISAAGAIAQDVAGVSIIGLGFGGSRPLISFDNTAATWAISAANCTVKNIRVKSTVNELVKMFNITAADVTLDGVDVEDPGSAKECIQFALTTSAADNLTIQNCVHYASTAAASAQKWIALVSCDRPIIRDNIFILKLFDHATSSVINGDANVTNAIIMRNTILMTGFSSASLSPILMTSGATGMSVYNNVASDVSAITTSNDFPTGYSVQTLCVNTVDKSGIIDPVADT